MHYTALESARRFFEIYANTRPEASAQKKLLDIGSLDVNGSIKEVCPSHVHYTGVDFVEGKGVDVILQDPYQLPFPDQSFDFVMSSSCYEHSEMFWLSFLEALRVIKEDGLLYLSTPSNAAFHRYPVDCWRFYPDSGQALVTWAKKNGYDCVLLESYIGNQKQGRVNDCVIVIAKNSSSVSQYPYRIIQKYNDFTNGRINFDENILNLEWETEDHRSSFKDKLKIKRRRFKSALKNLMKR